jgi:hypothetical protein
LIERLAALAMERLISSTEEAPVGATSSPGKTSLDPTTLNALSSMSPQSFDKHLTIQENLKIQERNQRFCLYFRLPPSEVLHMNFKSTLWTREFDHVEGQSYVSQTYYCFASKEVDACVFVLPLYCVKKLEKIKQAGALANAIAITTYDAHRICFTIGMDREKLCNYLKAKLSQNTNEYKRVRGFVLPTPQAADRADVVVLKVAKHGFGFSYGFLADAEQ